MKTFKQLDESRFLEKIHNNVTASTVKKIASTSPHKSARFIVDYADQMHAADGGRYTHDMISQDEDYHTSGVIHHHEDGKHYMKVHGLQDHPTVQRLLKAGVIHDRNKVKE